MSKNLLCKILIVTILCSGCATTLHHNAYNSREPIWMIENYGRLNEPISLNYFGISNIEKITTGGKIKNKRDVITIYLKDSVQLISFDAFLKRNGLTKKRRKCPIYLDTNLVSRPSGLVFVASQKFRIDSVPFISDGESSQKIILKVSPIK